MKQRAVIRVQRTKDGAVTYTATVSVNGKTVTGRGSNEKVAIEDMRRQFGERQAWADLKAQFPKFVEVEL